MASTVDFVFPVCDIPITVPSAFPIFQDPLLSWQFPVFQWDSMEDVERVDDIVRAWRFTGTRTAVINGEGDFNY